MCRNEGCSNAAASLTGSPGLRCRRGMNWLCASCRRPSSAVRRGCDHVPVLAVPESCASSDTPSRRRTLGHRDWSWPGKTCVHGCRTLPDVQFISTVWPGLVASEKRKSPRSTCYMASFILRCPRSWLVPSPFGAYADWPQVPGRTETNHGIAGTTIGVRRVSVPL